MTRLLAFALLLGLLLAQPARAQTAPPAAPAADSLAQVARDDTAVALQRLFFERRRLSRFVLPALGTAASVFSLATTEPQTTYQRISTGAFGLVAGYYTYQLVLALADARRYRPARERRALEALEQGQPLPPRLRRRLGTRYFSVKTT